MADVVGDEDQIGGLGAREIAEAPRIDLNDLAGVLDLHAGMENGVISMSPPVAGTRSAAAAAARTPERANSAAANFCARIFQAI